MKLAEGIDLGRPSHKNHVQNGQVISFFTQNEDYFPFGPEGVFDTICCKNISRKFKVFRGRMDRKKFATLLVIITLTLK